MKTQSQHEMLRHSNVRTDRETIVHPTGFRSSLNGSPSGAGRQWHNSQPISCPIIIFKSSLRTDPQVGAKLDSRTLTAFTKGGGETERFLSPSRGAPNRTDRSRPLISTTYRKVIETTDCINYLYFILLWFYRFLSSPFDSSPFLPFLLLVVNCFIYRRTGQWFPSPGRCINSTPQPSWSLSMPLLEICLPLFMVRLGLPVSC